jgi:hypothetical protein
VGCVLIEMALRFPCQCKRGCADRYYDDPKLASDKARWDLKMSALSLPEQNKVIMAQLIDIKKEVAWFIYVCSTLVVLPLFVISFVPKATVTNNCASS